MTPTAVMQAAREPASSHMGAVVSAAQTEMARLIQRGGLENDPLRHPIEALALHLGVQHDLMRDLVARLKTMQAPITPDEIQALNHAAARHTTSELTYVAKALVKQEFWKLSVLGAAAMVAGGLACGGIGAALVWKNSPALIYQDQPDGSRVGYYFVRPAPKHASPAAPTPPEETHAPPDPSPTKPTTAARKS